MIPDPNPLQERLARALVLSPYVRGQLSKIGPVMKRREAERIALAAAVLPIIAAAEHERDQAVGTALTAQQALDQMEHRATRAEVQSETRRLHLGYWQGVARGNAIAADVWKESAEEAEARIKAVQDVLDDLEQQPPDQIGWDAAGLLPVFRRALDS